MRNLIPAVSAIALLTLVACAAPEPAAEEPAAPAVDLAAEAQAVRDLSAKWLAAAQAKDEAAAAAVFAEDGVTIFDGTIDVGRAAIQASNEAENAENPDSTITWTTTEVHVAEAGDMAYERGNWTFDPDGEGAAPAELGEFVTVYRKIDGAWMVVADAGTTLEAASAE